MSDLIRYENDNGSYEVTCNASCDVFDDFIENLVIPVALAAGYSRETIERYMGDK
jgi:hypothetical protein